MERSFSLRSFFLLVTTLCGHVQNILQTSCKHPAETSFPEYKFFSSFHSLQHSKYPPPPQKKRRKEEEKKLTLPQPRMNSLTINDLMRMQQEIGQISQHQKKQGEKIRKIEIAFSAIQSSLKKIINVVTRKKEITTKKKITTTTIDQVRKHIIHMLMSHQTLMKMYYTEFGISECDRCKFHCWLVKKINESLLLESVGIFEKYTDINTLLSRMLKAWRKLWTDMKKKKAQSVGGQKKRKRKPAMTTTSSETKKLKKKLGKPIPEEKNGDDCELLCSLGQPIS